MVPTTLHPEIWIVLLNWNQYALTAQCLRSLQKVTYPMLRSLLVDNGSQDGSAQRIKAEFEPGVLTLVNAENLGYAGGNNAGIRHALDHGADYVLLLNNDTVVAPDFVVPLLERFRANAKTGAATAKIYLMNATEVERQTDEEVFWAVGGQIDWWWGAARCRGQGQVDRGQYDQPATVDYTQGCCMLVSKDAWQTVGLLDDQYFAYFEDGDWSMRCRAAGFELWYEPASVVWHLAGQALAVSGSHNDVLARRRKVFRPQAHYLHTRNGLWFFRRYGRGIRGVVGLLAFCIQALGFSVKLAAWGEMAAACAVWRGLVSGWVALPSPQKASHARSVTT